MSTMPAGHTAGAAALPLATILRSQDPRLDIFDAAELGQARRVAELLRETPDLAHACRSDGTTPLHLAAAGGHLEVMEQLLAHGADPNARDERGQTPLHALVLRCTRSEVVECLLARGADLNARDRHGVTPLLLAADCIWTPMHSWGDHRGLTDFLLTRGAALDVWTATILNRPGELSALLDADPALVNARQRVKLSLPEGASPLHYAADRGHPEVARLLLERGADVDARDGRGRPPLYLAAHEWATRKMRPPQEVVDLLLAHGAPLHIFTAAVLGQTGPAIELLDADPSLVNARDAGGYTPLHLAVWNGRLEMAKLLLARGAEMEAVNERGETPLALGAIYEYSNGDVIHFLLDRGAVCDLFTAVTLAKTDAVAARLREDPARARARNRYGRTPLEEALQKAPFIPEGTAWGSPWDIAQLLLDHGAAADLDLLAAAALGRREEAAAILAADPAQALARGACGFTPLHWAAHRGHAALASLLLDHGADVSACNTLRDRTPLHWAAASGHPEVVGLLLRHGAEVSGVDNTGLTPLHAAAETGNAAVVARLLDHGADLTAPNGWSGTPLHVAAQGGHAEVVELLLARGAATGARDRWHRTPLHAAAWHGRSAVVERLLAAGASVAVENQCHSTPLHMAAENGHTAIVSLLLEHGAAVNSPSDWGRTPLHVAAQGGHEATVRRLLSRGADVHARNKWQATPLHWVAEKGHAAVVALLLASGAEIDAGDERGRTPLHAAVWEGHFTVVELLLEQGASLQAATDRGNTPLHTAIQAGRQEIAALLLARGADVNASNRWQNAPLHVAAWHGRAELAELLLRSGAVVEPKEREGKTPLQQALERGHREVAELLSRHGAAA